MGLLSIVCSCTALFVTGIRRLPGLEMDVDEFKFAVQKRKPKELVGLLSSLVQGSSHAKWSDIGDNISAIIDDLAKDVVSVLTSENEASQDQVFRETNAYNYWIEVRTLGEEQARLAEKALGEAVDAELLSATDFHNNHSEWTEQMKKVLAPCREQESLMDVDIAVSPQSSFICDLSKDTGDLNCDNSFAAYETNVTDEVSALNTSYLAEKSVYLTWQGYCVGNISDANSKFGATEQAFNDWRALRATVEQKYEARKQTVCGSSASCADGDVSKLKGLNTIVSQECGSGKSIRDTKAKIGSDNTSQSLADRNYEVESLNVVHCLLDKLKSFNDDQWNDESVANIVETCSGEGAPAEFAKYDIDFETSSEQSFTDTTSCYAAAFSGVETLTDLYSASIYDPLTSTAKRDVKVDYDKDGAIIYSQIGVGIPDTFVGTVNVPTAWSEQTVDTTECQNYFCASRTDTCFTEVERTEMKCDKDSINGETYRTLKSGHLVEFSQVVGKVPTSYTQGSQSLRVFADDHLAGC